ncbi:metallophosphoesterase [Lysinibacillus endophyticus]|uniref:metallophosphoesterase n=1 Tax=Ureibacillus endophyticus TaxID=1978490 RepID=UPI0031349300
MKIEVGKGIDFIGDIHACYDEFIELLDKLGYQLNNGLYIHPDGRKIVSLGDVMSRGPQSIKCMEFFLNHVNAGLAYMIDSNHGWKIARWLMGRKVKLSHGDENVEEEFREFEKLEGNKETEKLKEEIKELLLNAPSHYIFTVDGEARVVCTHAGIRDDFIGKENDRIKNFCRYGDVAGMDEKGKPIRKEWYKEHKGDLLIIWGHDPKREPLIVNNTINIDQGVVFGGKLTCYRYPEEEFVFVKAAKNYSGRIGEDNPINR